MDQCISDKDRELLEQIRGYNREDMIQKIMSILPWASRVEVEHALCLQDYEILEDLKCQPS
jgi:hypothetical protein